MSEIGGYSLCFEHDEKIEVRPISAIPRLPLMSRFFRPVTDIDGTVVSLAHLSACMGMQALADKEDLTALLFSRDGRETDFVYHGPLETAESPDDAIHPLHGFCAADFLVSSLVRNGFVVPVVDLFALYDRIARAADAGENAETPRPSFRCACDALRVPDGSAEYRIALVRDPSTGVMGDFALVAPRGNSGTGFADAVIAAAILVACIVVAISLFRSASGDGRSAMAAMRSPVAGASGAPTAAHATPAQSAGPGMPTSAPVATDAYACDYTVLPGDYLANIALRLTGDSYNYPEIAKDARIRNPDLIFPGQTLRIRKRY
jgi:hypothetical protein